jgi:hypothetical protein
VRRMQRCGCTGRTEARRAGAAVGEVEVQVKVQVKVQRGGRVEWWRREGCCWRWRGKREAVGVAESNDIPAVRCSGPHAMAMACDELQDGPPLSQHNSALAALSRAFTARALHGRTQGTRLAATKSMCSGHATYRCP